MKQVEITSFLNDHSQHVSSLSLQFFKDGRAQGVWEMMKQAKAGLESVKGVSVTLYSLQPSAIRAPEQRVLDQSTYFELEQVRHQCRQFPIIMMSQYALFREADHN